jgi:hypothetical protein
MMIFIGTDATENWNNTISSFKALSFDREKHGVLKLWRHIYVDKSGKTAWFDELLK